MGANQIPGLCSRHLAQGSKCPALQRNVLRAYNMRYCPFAQRTLLVLVAKRIPFEVVNVNLVDKPDWFWAKNPLGKVPILEINDTIIYESAICNEWLDRMYPDSPRIMQSDPKERAMQLMRAERASVLITKFYEAVRKPEKFPDIVRALETCDELLEGRTFFEGSIPGWTDYMIWPWLERLPAINLILQGEYNIDPLPLDYRNLGPYIAHMQQRSEVQTLMLTPEDHLRFMKSFRSGKPQYDFDDKPKM